MAEMPLHLYDDHYWSVCTQASADKLWMWVGATSFCFFLLPLKRVFQQIVPFLPCLSLFSFFLLPVRLLREVKCQVNWTIFHFALTAAGIWGHLELLWHQVMDQAKEAPSLSVMSLSGVAGRSWWEPRQRSLSALKVTPPSQLRAFPWRQGGVCVWGCGGVCVWWVVAEGCGSEFSLIWVIQALMPR